MKPEPVFAAVESLVPVADPQCEVILLSPQGAPLNQPLARELARKRRLVLICGHYEGFDERIRQHLGTRAVSIGDYVLTGGEIPAMVLIDCVGRLVDGVLPADATEAESHTENLLEYPQYTRPATFRQWAVPEVLLSGNHERIAAWRRLQALKRTRELRPDLWQQLELTERDRKLLAEDEEAGDE